MKPKSSFMHTLYVMRVELILLILCALCFLLALGAPLACAAEALYTAEEAALLDAYESGELIRLHVLANDDSPENQRVKLLVRDALLAAFSGTLAKAGEQSANAVYAALLENAEGMRRVAEDCARANGFAGGVTAEVGRLRLPQKRYGRVLLPEGEYRGLRVTLGDGAGQNWWCVLFPQLCLAVAGDGEADETVAPDDADAARENAPELVWGSKRIFSKWLACEAKDCTGKDSSLRSE